MDLILSSGETIQVDEVLLATGFGKKLPGGRLIQRGLIERFSLQVSDGCGFPVVNPHLQWHSRIFMTGGSGGTGVGTIGKKHCWGSTGRRKDLAGTMRVRPTNTRQIYLERPQQANSACRLVT